MRLATWRFGALMLWVIGVQVHEALATIGLALTASAADNDVIDVLFI